MANDIRPPKAPNLPLAPADYVRSYFDQFANILRMYFNQLDGYNTITNSAIGNFQARTTQTLVGANTAKLVSLDMVLESLGVNLDTATYRMSVMQSGRYLFVFDVPSSVGGWGGGAGRYFWFRLNGVDIVESTHIMSGSCMINLTPTDYVELYWASTSATDTISPTAATGFCPAMPAININITFVST
jgi:hypothetical protein